MSIPMLPLISTPRLRLRPLVAADWAAVYAYAGDAAVMHYMVEPGTMTEHQAREYAAGGAAEAGAVGIELAENGKLAGQLVFHPWFAPRTYEIGWVVHPRFQGQGYASEAATAVLRFGFERLDLHRVIATCQPENHASYRVMERIGMRREGHFRRCIYRGGDEWWDELFYALLETEWAGRQAQCVTQAS